MSNDRRDEGEPAHRPPLEDALDLHHFRPKEAKALVDEYLWAARQAGYGEVRLIHGKGTGQLREKVHAVLRRHPCVADFKLAPQWRGGWGATMVTLGEGPPKHPTHDAAAPEPAQAEAPPPDRGPAIHVLLALAAAGAGLAMAWNWELHPELFSRLLAVAAGTVLILSIVRRSTAPAFRYTAAFLLPFHALAAEWSLGHVVALLVLAEAAVVWTWPPAFRNVLVYPLMRAYLHAVVAFFGLHLLMALVVELPPEQAWWTAAGLAGAWLLAAGFPETRNGWLGRLATLPLLVFLFSIWRQHFPLCCLS